MTLMRKNSKMESFIFLITSLLRLLGGIILIAFFQKMMFD